MEHEALHKCVYWKTTLRNYITDTHTHWVTKGYKYLMTSLALNPSCNPLKTRWEPPPLSCLGVHFQGLEKVADFKNPSATVFAVGEFPWIPTGYAIRGSNCHGFWTKNLPVPAPVEMVRRFQPEPRSQPIRAPALTAVLLVTGSSRMVPMVPTPALER